MEKRNLYAPPKAKVIDASDTDCSRDGKTVIIPLGSDFPPRCIKCNAPAKTPVKEIKLYWHTPWLYLLILINILVYAIVGLIVRRTVKVSPGLCEVHSARRSRGIFMFIGLGVVCCAAGAWLVNAGNTGLAMAFFGYTVIWLVIGMRVSRKVYAKKITKEYARIGGCKEPFLASLEEV